MYLEATLLQAWMPAALSHPILYERPECWGILRAFAMVASLVAGKTSCGDVV